jgi:hypothetical protein
MNNYLNIHLYIALNAIIIVFVLLVGSWYIHYTNEQLVRSITTHLTEAQTKLVELATLTDSNGANEFVLTIISDCPRRTDFESYLSRLGTQNTRDLLTTQQLFESCGAFYAERKALMVSEMEREYEKMLVDLTYLKELRDLTPDETAYQRWYELIRLERERSAFLTEQTALQEDIIRLLIEGNSAALVGERVRHAQNIAESLTVTDAHIDTLRSELIN